MSHDNIYCARLTVEQTHEALIGFDDLMHYTNAVSAESAFKKAILLQNGSIMKAANYNIVFMTNPCSFSCGIINNFIKTAVKSVPATYDFEALLNKLISAGLNPAMAIFDNWSTTEELGIVVCRDDSSYVLCIACNELSEVEYVSWILGISSNMLFRLEDE